MGGACGPVREDVGRLEVVPPEPVGNPRVGDPPLPARTLFAAEEGGAHAVGLEVVAHGPGRQPRHAPPLAEDDDRAPLLQGQGDDPRPQLGELGLADDAAGSALPTRWILRARGSDTLTSGSSVRRGRFSESFRRGFAAPKRSATRE